MPSSPPAATLPADPRATARAEALRRALRSGVVIADGAMGTQIQAQNPSLADFEGYEGCNEILNVTRPDIIAAVHDAYLAAGVDAIETNTFGTNWSNLGDYGIADRITELAQAGAAIARERADAFATEDRPRWVLGSIGPGTKLPTLGHVTYTLLKDTFAQQAAGLLAGGVDAVIVETCQDLLQAKAAINGAKSAMAGAGRRVPIIAQITVETTGTMLLGTQVEAALVTLQHLGVDAIGMNCATGPDLMGEHLRELVAGSPVPITCMPNAGLPVLGPNGASYPLTPDQLARAHVGFIRDFGLGLVGGCCGTTPEHLAAVVRAVRGDGATAPLDAGEPVGHGTTPDGISIDLRENPSQEPALDGFSRPSATIHLADRTRPTPPDAVASLYTATDLRQETSFLAIGERTNANGSKAFREAMLAQNWDECVAIARAQTRDGAHLLDVCVDYVGRDGVFDAREVFSRLASASTLPLVVDSTEPAVLQTALELIGGRAVVNSVNFEDGDGPTSRFAKVMPLVKEHGAAVIALTIDEDGQARTAAAKVAVATRLIETLTREWGLAVSDIIVDCLTFPIATGQEETRRDAIETIEAIRTLVAQYPGLHTTLGVSNVSFGLSPAARVVLNSVFLHEAVEAGLDSAIVHAAKILPLAAIPEKQRQVALDLIWDRRKWDDAGNLTYDPLSRMLDMFAGVNLAALRDARAAELAALPVSERLGRRIVDGERKGLEADLDAALASGLSALDIVNDHLLAGMKTVGELFGSGQMQLPFVLQSAETMKAAVAYLEPHMERTGGASKGTIVLATVRGDVHDIGKNLVDIILTNNGYTVVNIGIKQPVSAMIDAAIEHDADVIGMSGLLVKSTVVMKENLGELTARGLAKRWPILLGGAALTRTYVEDDLASSYDGVVRYAKDAFEGLRLMEPLVRVARGADPDEVGLPALKKRRHAVVHVTQTEPADMPARSDVASDNEVPVPPFWGTRVVRDIPLADYAAFLDERATFMGQWGLKPGRAPQPAGATETPQPAETGRESSTRPLVPRDLPPDPPQLAPSTLPVGASATYEELVEAEGRPRLARWLERIEAERILEPTVIYGYFPAWSEGDTVVVAQVPDDADASFVDQLAAAVSLGSGVSATEDSDGSDRVAGGAITVDGTEVPLTRFTFPRQRRDRHLCLADFVRPREWVAETGRFDVLPVQLVTVGAGVAEHTATLFAEDRYREYMELHGLSVQLTEALAEAWHARVRAELGFAGEDPNGVEGMLGVKYRGARFSLGYPACPDMEDRRKVVALLRPERAGVTLSEELQLHPEQSTDAFVFHHPEAKYFSV